jgi:hypothetical protein
MVIRFASHIKVRKFISLIKIVKIVIEFEVLNLGSRVMMNGAEWCYMLSGL